MNTFWRAEKRKPRCDVSSTPIKVCAIDNSQWMVHGQGNSNSSGVVDLNGDMIIVALQRDFA